MLLWSIAKGIFTHDESLIINSLIYQDYKDWSLINGGADMGLSERVPINTKYGSVACWICPDGEVMGVHGSHTSTVIEAPEVFDLGKEEAEGLFAAGEEKAVLTHLIKQGWVRIRYQGSCYFVSVNFLTFECRKNLTSWSLGVLKSYPDRESATVIIDELENNNTCKVSLKSISVGDFSHNGSLKVNSQVYQDYKDWTLISSGSVTRRFYKFCQGKN